MGDAALDLHGQFRKQLRAFRRGLPGLEQGDVEALHRTRIASRRLRELLPLVDIRHQTRKKLLRRLRQVTRLLGKLREMDVLALLIDTLILDGQFVSAVERVSGEVAKAQSAAREQLAAKLPATKLEQLARKIKLAARACKADGETRRDAHSSRARRWALEARQARRAQDLRLAIESAGTLYSPEPLHRVRVAIKKFRYAAELATAIDGRRMKTALATLETAQDRLGHLHDKEVFLQWARAAQASSVHANLTEWRDLGALAGAIEDRCREEHAHYLHQRASLLAIADRLGGRKPTASDAKGRRAAG